MVQVQMSLAGFGVNPQDVYNYVRQVEDRYAYPVPFGELVKGLNVSKERLEECLDVLKADNLIRETSPNRKTIRLFSVCSTGESGPV